MTGWQELDGSGRPIKKGWTEHLPASLLQKEIGALVECVDEDPNRYAVHITVGGDPVGTLAEQFESRDAARFGAARHVHEKLAAMLS